MTDVREEIRSHVRDLHLQAGATIADANEIADLVMHAAETARRAMNDVCDRGSNPTVVLSALVLASQVAAVFMSALAEYAIEVAKGSGLATIMEAQVSL